MGAYENVEVEPTHDSAVKENVLAESKWSEKRFAYMEKMTSDSCFLLTHVKKY